MNFEVCRKNNFKIQFPCKEMSIAGTVFGILIAVFLLQSDPCKFHLPLRKYPKKLNLLLRNF